MLDISSIERKGRKATLREIKELIRPLVEEIYEEQNKNGKTMRDNLLRPNEKSRVIRGMANRIYSAMQHE